MLISNRSTDINDFIWHKVKEMFRNVRLPRILCFNTGWLTNELTTVDI